MAIDYDRFLVRSAAALASAGAQLLLPAADAARAAPWASGWDQILLADGPGSQTLYAFTRVNGGNVQEQLDRLAEGLSQNGVLGRSPVPVSLVAVAVLPHGAESRRIRGLTGLTPSRYYPGLRPSTWVVDLAGEKVHTGGLGRKAEGKDLIQQAASADSVQVLDAGGLDALQQRHVEQTQAFYRLMRGRQPLVTYALVAINVAVFLLMYTQGGPGNDATLRNFGALSPQLIEQGQWWRLVTAMFLHASVTHIVFNMVSLVAIGTLAERLYGNTKFLAIYLGSGLIGSLTSFGYSVLTGSLNILGVGASGAIFGVAGALLTVRFHSSDVIPKRLRNQISSSMLPLVALSLIIARLTPNVDNSAHIGGLIGGMILSFVFPLTRRVRETADVS